MAKYLDYTGLQYLWTKIKNYVSTQPLGANVRYDAQTLTTAQQEQARKNIAAGGSNPNLLDNAYFVGGGSQLGDGIFPINQRGQTSYSSVGYGIDRWRGETGYASVALATDGLKFCSSTSGQWGTLVQLVASAKYLAGETVTISAIIDGTLIYTTYTLPSSGSYDLTAVNVNGIYINLYSPDGVNIQFRIYTQETTQHTIKAAKLEKGTVSTLANDAPPNYWEELERCLPYLWIWKLPAYNFSGVVLYAGDATNGTIVLTAPVSMREGQPTVAFTNTMYFGVGGTINSVLWAVIKNNRVTIACATSGGMTSGSLYPTNAGANDVTITIANEL